METEAEMTAYMVTGHADWTGPAETPSPGLHCDLVPGGRRGRDHGDGQGDQGVQHDHGRRLAGFELRSTITVTRTYVEEVEDPVTGQLQLFEAATEAELERLVVAAFPQDEVAQLAPAEHASQTRA